MIIEKMFIEESCDTRHLKHAKLVIQEKMVLYRLLLLQVICFLMSLGSRDKKVKHVGKSFVKK